MANYLLNNMCLNQRTATHAIYILVPHPFSLCNCVTVWRFISWFSFGFFRFHSSKFVQCFEMHDFCSSCTQKNAFCRRISWSKRHHLLRRFTCCFLWSWTTWRYRIQPHFKYILTKNATKLLLRSGKVSCALEYCETIPNWHLSLVGFFVDTEHRSVRCELGSRVWVSAIMRLCVCLYQIYIYDCKFVSDSISEHAFTCYMRI